MDDTLPGTRMLTSPVFRVLFPLNPALAIDVLPTHTRHGCQLFLQRHKEGRNSTMMIERLYQTRVGFGVPDDICGQSEKV